MIPRKTIRLVSSDGEVDIKATYGSPAIALTAIGAAVTFTTLDEYNQLGVSAESAWQTTGLAENETIYGSFSVIEVASGNLNIHVK